MIEVVRFDDAAAFLEQAEQFLLADEARHNLLLGIAGTIRDSPDLYPLRNLWLVRDAGEVAAAALRTPPYNLILARPRSAEALAALVEAVAGEEMPGLVGTEPEVHAFAKLWSGRTGIPTRTNMRQGVFALEQVVQVPSASGSPRVATENDHELALRWWIDFGEEVLHEGNPGRERAAQSVAHKLSSPTDGICLWEDAGETVSLAGWGSPTPNGIRIGPVYTPPELRGRGYATTLTAELSQRLLDGRLFDGGRLFCFLYTDLANPTSNAIYERIGYRRIAEAAEIVFG
jgi:predicted GNAT family acetyltransferase